MATLSDKINEVIEQHFSKQWAEVHKLLNDFRQQNPDDADYYIYMALRNSGGNLDALQYQLAHIDEQPSQFAMPSPLGEKVQALLQRVFPKQADKAQQICLSLSKNGFSPNSAQAEPLRKIVEACIERSGGNLDALQKLIQQAKTVNATWRARFAPYVAQYVVISLKNGQTLDSSALESINDSSVYLYYGGKMNGLQEVKFADMEDFY